jgi:hypothetical protein
MKVRRIEKTRRTLERNLRRDNWSLFTAKGQAEEASVAVGGFREGELGGIG